MQPSRIRPKQLNLVEIIVRLVDVPAAGGVLAHGLAGAREPNYTSQCLLHKTRDTPQTDAESPKREKRWSGWGRARPYLFRGCCPASGTCCPS